MASLLGLDLCPSHEACWGASWVPFTRVAPETMLSWTDQTIRFRGYLANESSPGHLRSPSVARPRDPIPDTELSPRSAASSRSSFGNLSSSPEAAKRPEVAVFSGPSGQTATRRGTQLLLPERTCRVWRASLSCSPEAPWSPPAPLQSHAFECSPLDLPHCTES